MKLEESSKRRVKLSLVHNLLFSKTISQLLNFKADKQKCIPDVSDDWKCNKEAPVWFTWKKFNFPVDYKQMNPKHACAWVCDIKNCSWDSTREDDGEGFPREEDLFVV